MNCNRTLRVLVIGALAVLASANAAVQAATPAEADLVGLWKFEEGSGKLVKDSSTNHNNGTLLGADAREPGWGTGEFAGSVSLSGTNDNHVRIPASASLNTLTKHITVTAHVYPRTLWAARPRWAFWADEPKGTGFIALVQRQWRDVMHPDLFYLGFGQKKAVLRYKWHLGLIGDDDVSLYCLPPSGNPPPVGEWVHLAGTYDGDTGKMSMYVNGEQICTRTIPGMIRLDPQSMNRPLVIGAELNGPDINDAMNEFDGYIDEVRIYDRALGDGEIKALADESKKRMSR